MNPIVLHPFVFYGLAAFSFIFMAATVICMIILIKRNYSDVLLFFDKSERFSLIFQNLAGLSEFVYNGKTYPLLDSASVLNKRGKSLFGFNEGNPKPIIFKKNVPSDIDSKTLTVFTNNKLIRKLVEPTSAAMDFLIIAGAIGGLVAGLAATIHLLIATGVIG